VTIEILSKNQKFGKQNRNFAKNRNIGNKSKFSLKYWEKNDAIFMIKILAKKF